VGPIAHFWCLKDVLAQIACWWHVEALETQFLLSGGPVVLAGRSTAAFNACVRDCQHCRAAVQLPQAGDQVPSPLSLTPLPCYFFQGHLSTVYHSAVTSEWL
jgi:hypothetical protein